MKRLVIVMLSVVLLAGLVGLAGCAVLPSGVKASLYTADAVLRVTVDEVQANKSTWAVDPNASLEEQVAALQLQKLILTATMDQAEKNLAIVIKYVEEKESPVPTTGGDK